VLVGRYATLTAARTAGRMLRQGKFAGAFEVTTRYGLTLKDPALSQTLPEQTRDRLLSHGFTPYQGVDGHWLVGAYARKSEAQAMARELTAAGLAMQVVKW